MKWPEPVGPEMPDNIKAERAREVERGIPEKGGILTMWRELLADIIDVVGGAQCSCALPWETFVNLIRQEWERQFVEQEFASLGLDVNLESPVERMERLRGCRCKSKL